MTSPLTTNIRRATDAGRVALIPFLPAGYPDKKRFWKELEMLDKAGAAVIEIGMPFSDPVADGPVVEKASLKCLDDGINLKWIMDGLKERKGLFKAALLLMGYLNPVYQFGVKEFAKEASEGGVSGLIIADLPFEESDFVKEALKPQGISLVPLVGLNTSPERMRLYAKDATGFAYFVSVLGTTGQRESLPGEIREMIIQAREIFDIPVALGFGLKRPEQLKELEGLVDAAVFGSALISHIDQGGDSAGFMKAWE